MSTPLSEPEAQRDHLKVQLSDLGDSRPGSLTESYRKCGKANCHSAQPDEQGHGLSWSLTHDVKGKTITKIIPKAFVSQTREHIAEYQRLRCGAEKQVTVQKKLRSPLNWLATSPLNWMNCSAATPRITRVRLYPATAAWLALPKWILPARPAPRYGENLFFACYSPHGRNRLFNGEFSGRQPVVAGTGWRPH